MWNNNEEVIAGEGGKKNRQVHTIIAYQVEAKWLTNSDEKEES